VEGPAVQRRPFLERFSDKAKRGPQQLQIPSTALLRIFGWDNKEGVIGRTLFWDGLSSREHRVHTNVDRGRGVSSPDALAFLAPEK
jgi:hypothetical protein